MTKEEILERITDTVNPYPRSCYRELNLEKLADFLLELTQK